jgi:hypothetical protein
MPSDPNAVLFSDETSSALERLLRTVRAECDSLEATLPAAYAAQWLPSPVPRPREDTAERAKGGHGDPTPSIALDDRRLAVREQLHRSEAVVRDAVVAVRGVRRGLEMRLVEWEGEKEDEA